MSDGCGKDDAGDPALRAAAEWLARQRLGRIDERAFARWRDSDPAHAVAFCRVLALWRAELPDGIAEATPSRPAGLALPASRRDLLRAGGMGAIGLALAGGAFVAPAYAWHSAATGIGENRRIVLPDGSSVELNTDSSLSWRFSERQRTFWLERGEICLSLCPGAAATLHSRADRIAMSDGLFNIRAGRTATELLVARGGARIGGAGASRQVAAGANGARIATVTDGIVSVQPADADRVAVRTAWRDRAILFHDVTLGDAVAEYNRYLSHRIAIADRDLAATPVGGRFETSDPAAFLKAISIALDIEVLATGDGYVLTRRRNG